MLGKVLIANDPDTGATSVSNLFIDAYMADANDAQIKIYLYLLRVWQSGRATTVSEIADVFNHTEREVKRALTYWEKKGLVRLEYDGKRLVQIGLEDLSGTDMEEVPATPVRTRQPVREVSVTAVADRQEAAEETPLPQEGKTAEEEAPPAQAGKKRRYTPKEIDGFREDEALSMTLFAAEQYFKRSLNPTEIQTILYCYDELGFPADLIDYLLQYTAENAKGRLSSYMEKTAIAWHGEGVRTLQDALSRGTRYDKRVYDIMRALGLSNAPTPFENGYFERWWKEYGFSMDLILEACRKTVFRKQTHRVEYADGILSDWHTHGVATLEDVAALDEAHDAAAQTRRKKKDIAEKNGGTVIDTRNRFNRFKQHDYDFEELKRKFVSNN